MKKLLIIILIITLPLIAFFQYKQYSRFNPPASYEYELSDRIDVDYHDYALVEEYFKTGVEIGAFARSQWRNEDVDVRFPDADVVAEINAANWYNQMLSRVKLIEEKLERSAALKAEGYSNAQIQLIEEGTPKEQIPWLQDRFSITQIAFGNQSKYVWWVQEKLIQKGYEHELDGLFGIDTQNAILTFQQDQNLYPSGQIDSETFEKLFLE